jgi:hypothetical protein
MRKIDKGFSLEKYFEGNWIFERMIFDYNNERRYGVANGIANFTPVDKKKLIYNEEGKLSLVASGQEFPFFRSFVYVFDGDQLEMFFNDGANSGQLYQHYSLDINNSVLTSSVQHICQDDYYNGIYSIISSTEYKLETLIKGPRKEFKIETYAKKAENMSLKVDKNRNYDL